MPRTLLRRSPSGCWHSGDGDGMKISTACMIAMVALACGESTGVEPLTLGELVGTWRATAIEVTNQLDTSLEEDLFASGVRWRMTVDLSGAFAVELSNSFGADSYAGTVTIVADSLVLTSAETNPTRVPMHYTFQSPVLTVAWAGTEQCGSYGWRAAQCPIPVIFRMTLEKE